MSLNHFHHHRRQLEKQNQIKSAKKAVRGFSLGYVGIGNSSSCPCKPCLEIDKSSKKPAICLIHATKRAVQQEICRQNATRSTPVSKPSFTAMGLSHWKGRPTEEAIDVHLYTSMSIRQHQYFRASSAQPQSESRISTSS